MMHTLITLTLALAATSAHARVTAEQVVGSIDNVAVAASITSEAIQLPEGKYFMQNVGTGEWIRYDNENGRQMFPIDDESKKSPIDFAPDTLDGVPYSRMSITDGRSFCPSAQWWYRENGLAELPGDFLAALYDCSIGSDATGNVRDAKQQWFIVDASSEFKLSVGIEAGTTRVAAGVDAAAPSDDQARIADTDDEEASDDQPRKKVTPKEEQPAPAEQEKPKKPVEEKPEKPVEETPKKPVEETATPTRKAVNRLEAVSRPTSTTRMAKCQRKRDVVRRNYEVLERAVQPLEKYLRTRRHQLQKRAGSRTVYIITADHAEDMQSRCLHGSVGTPMLTDVKGTRLEPCDRSTLQQWILTPA